MRAALEPARVLAPHRNLEASSPQNEVQSTSVRAPPASANESVASTISSIKSFPPSVLQGYGSDGDATLLLIILKRRRKPTVTSRERNLRPHRRSFCTVAFAGDFSHSFASSLADKLGYINCMLLVGCKILVDLGGFEPPTS